MTYKIFSINKTSKKNILDIIFTSKIKFSKNVYYMKLLNSNYHDENKKKNMNILFDKE